MDKKTFQTICVAVFAGMLFLQAIVAGGVASEEMGMVMDAMRSLRRSDTIFYDIITFSGEEETHQKIWVDFLSEQWVEELTVTDDDGIVVSWERFFDGKREWINDGQSGWDMTDSKGEAPGMTALTYFPLGADDIEKTECVKSADRVKLVFTIAGDRLEKRRREILAQMAEETADGGMNELSHRQNEAARFKDVVMTYVLDKKGELREIQFAMQVTRPQLVLRGGGKYELGEDETYRMGYNAKVIRVNSSKTAKKIKNVCKQFSELNCEE